jgi:hypothetical protein
MREWRHRGLGYSTSEPRHSREGKEPIFVYWARATDVLRHPPRSICISIEWVRLHFSNKQGVNGSILTGSAIATTKNSVNFGGCSSGCGNGSTIQIKEKTEARTKTYARGRNVLLKSRAKNYLSVHVDVKLWYENEQTSIAIGRHAPFGAQAGIVGPQRWFAFSQGQGPLLERQRCNQQHYRKIMLYSEPLTAMRAPPNLRAFQSRSSMQTAPIELCGRPSGDRNFF